jgi:hypothetical protein
MSQTVSLAPPTLFQDPDQQILANQAALQQLQQAVNANATDSAVYATIPTVVLSGTVTHNVSATPTLLDPTMSFSFQANGGLVRISANWSVYTNTGGGQSVGLQLVLDGVMVAQRSIYASTGYIRGCLSFDHTAVLSVGTHTVQFLAVGTGSMVVNGSSETSEYSVAEIPLT